MHPSVTPLAGIFRLNTELVLNCIADLPDELAQKRAGERPNSIAFLVAHLTETRHFLAAMLGQPIPSPFSAAFTSARSIEQAGPLPPVALLIRYWEAMAAHLAVIVERLDTPQLSRTVPPLPGSDGSTLGNLAFLAQHESYHLGQIALLRRALDLPPMSYRLPSREPGRRGA